MDDIEVYTLGRLLIEGVERANVTLSSVGLMLLQDTSLDHIVAISAANADEASDILGGMLIKSFMRWAHEYDLDALEKWKIREENGKLVWRSREFVMRMGKSDELNAAGSQILQLEVTRA